MRRFPGIVLELRTARANSVPHGTIRFGRSAKKWTPKDRLLAVALTVHEDGLCKGCGQPRDRSWNDDMAGLYVAHRATCQGCLTAHLAKESSPLKDADVLYVLDESPADFEPDPRTMSTRKE